MGWFRQTAESLADKAASSPVPCPRGWGEVQFQLEIDGFFPFVDIGRKCPIGGVESCQTCHHPFAPDEAERLLRSRQELEDRYRTGAIPEDEYLVRKRLVDELCRPFPDARERYRVAAWILAPIGVVMGLVGYYLMTEVHTAFVAILAVGGVILALAFSFGMLSQARDE